MAGGRAGKRRPDQRNALPDGPMAQRFQGEHVHAVLVVRHGTLVFEQYFSGSDEAWGRPIGNIAFGPEVRHDERSATKSIIALLLGIAIDHGLIKGIDEPLLSFFPEYADLRTPEKERITLGHLVTMSAGLEWHELDIPYTSAANSEIRMELSGDPYRFVLEQPVGAAGGNLELQFGGNRAGRSGGEKGGRQAGRRLCARSAV